MTQLANPIDVYLEIGQKRTLAGALAWPGWCRGGRDPDSALQALVDYGPRYAHVLRNSGLGFQPPADVSTLTVVERLAGNQTTDFGAPDVAPAGDAAAIDDAEHQRFQTLLTACWQAFDAAMMAATGKELRKGPRGGGRELEGIAQHVQAAERGYLARLAWKLPKQSNGDLRHELARTRQAVLDALAAAVRGETPKQGPRGGIIWSPRYFVRRVAWHALDHVWEIEDRAV
jgi:hypothetical protein